MYVFIVLVLLGVGVASASWILLLLAAITAIGVTRPISVRVEEAECIRHYGDAYRKYMENTPRWLGMPGS